jgi:hypothetical protein
LKIAHPLGAESFGSGVELTMSQNSTVTCFISPGRVLITPAVWGLGASGPEATDRHLETRRVEGRAALPAKFVFRRVAGTASWAIGNQRRTALAAEFHPDGTIRSASKALHPGSARHPSPLD